MGRGPRSTATMPFAQLMHVPVRLYFLIFVSDARACTCDGCSCSGDLGNHVRCQLVANLDQVPVQTISLSEETLVLATYQSAQGDDQDPYVIGHAAMKLYVDGVERPETRAVDEGLFRGQTGIYLGILGPGTHTFEVRYYTETASMTHSAGDWNVRALNVIPFPATSMGAVASFKRFTPLPLPCTVKTSGGRFRASKGRA